MTLARGPRAARSALTVLALAALAACAAPPQRPLPPSFAPDREARVLTSGPRLGPARGLPTAESDPTGVERAYATALLSDLQLRSFAGNREYCGYIGLDWTGRLSHTPPVAGTEASCPLPGVPAGFVLIASYHTHGTYSPWYASEWPTTQDVATDATDGIDGYISTPGGRLWHVDTDTLTVTQLCGRGCLPQDPNYVAADDGPVRVRMTYAELQRWERG